MYIYKVTLKSHLRHLLPIVFTILFCLSSCLIFYYFTLDFQTTLTIFIIVVFLSTWRAIIIYIEYCYYNLRIKLHIDYTNKVLIFESKSKSIRRNFNEINHIISFNHASGRGGLLPFRNYKHSTIYFENDSFIITSLIINELNLEDIPTRKIGCFRNNFYKSFHLNFGYKQSDKIIKGDKIARLIDKLMHP